MDDNSGDTELMAEVLRRNNRFVHIRGRGNGLPAPVTPGQDEDVDPMRLRSSECPGRSKAIVRGFQLGADCYVNKPAICKTSFPL
jgi:hypothetical protein